LIIDTSALVAAGWREEGHEAIFEALFAGNGLIPAPVLVEFRRVTALSGNRPDPLVDDLLADLMLAGVKIAPFDAVAAETAVAANPAYGSGNGDGAPLNLLDLMVYGIAQATGLPILCTGRDFASTDAVLHPASRPW
jgi:ribonuclease VapC